MEISSRYTPAGADVTQQQEAVLPHHHQSRSLARGQISAVCLPEIRHEPWLKKSLE
jgi:hypothetical protein